ncbi:MAG: hypothetical protein AB7V50_07900 [Vampirovibrionia bacterium]
MSDGEKKKISTKKMVIYIVLIVVIGLTIPLNMMRKSEAPPAQPQPAETSTTQQVPVE